MFLFLGPTGVGKTELAKALSAALFGSESRLVIPWQLDTTISRYHAQITKEGNRYFIEDLGSTSGTQLNGRHVKDKLEIPNSSGILIGSTLLRFSSNTKTGRAGEGDD